MSKMSEEVCAFLQTRLISRFVYPALMKRHLRKVHKQDDVNNDLAEDDVDTDLVQDNSDDDLAQDNSDDDLAQDDSDDDLDSEDNLVNQGQDSEDIILEDITADSVNRRAVGNRLTANHRRASKPQIRIVQYKEVNEMTKALALPDVVTGIAQRIYHQRKDSSQLRNRPIRTVVAACIFNACCQANVKITLREIAAELKIPDRNIARANQVIEGIINTNRGDDEYDHNGRSGDANLNVSKVGLDCNRELDDSPWREMEVFGGNLQEQVLDRNNNNLDIGSFLPAGVSSWTDFLEEDD
jgi:hypothetical protein